MNDPSRNLRHLLKALALFAAGATINVGASAAPPIRHVFVVMLENQPFKNTFGAGSSAPYLKALPQQGALLVNYFGISHESLGNYLALISGQAPSVAVNQDCERFDEFVSTGRSADGQAIGTGCVYPSSVSTLPNQLESAHLSWKGYMEDMGADPRRESASCGHPAVGAADNTQVAEAGDQYAARHDPFVYFHALIDGPSCERHVINLAALSADLRSVTTTPNYSFIVPNLCHDGHDGTGGGRCIDGEPGGLGAADRFLSKLVPKIIGSPAFRRDGLIMITFDESYLDETVDRRTGLAVLGGDAAACCNEQAGPNIPPYRPGAVGTWDQMNGPGIVGPGGGRVGAVVLSRYVRPGTISMVPYNHYAFLRSVEDIFHLPYLGYAGQTGLQGFGADLYTAPTAAGP